MTTKKRDAAAEDPGYEDARTELRDVLSRLESGGLSLEDSLALWERGEYLADVCRRWLDGASSRLDAAIAAHDEAAPSSGPPPSEPPSSEPAPSDEGSGR